MLNQQTTSDLTIGFFYGAPIKIHYTCLLTLLFLVFYDFQIALTWIGLFFIVFMHEIGHCISVVYLDQSVCCIYLSPAGGSATVSIKNNPLEEILVSFSGPLMNLLLTIPLWMISDNHSVFHSLYLFNNLLIISNLLPIFPMDGGRILRGFLLLVIKDRLMATKITLLIGEFLSIVMMGLSFWLKDPILAFISLAMIVILRLERTQMKSYEPEQNRIELETKSTP